MRKVPQSYVTLLHSKLPQELRLYLLLMAHAAQPEWPGNFQEFSREYIV